MNMTDARSTMLQYNNVYKNRDIAKV